MRFPWIWALSLVLAVPVAGLWALGTALTRPPAPAASPALVTFQDGTYSSYDSSATAGADNANASAVTIHQVTVRFIDERSAQVIAGVTEPVNAAVIPGGQAQRLTFAAPPAVTDAGIEDRQVTVTVTGWS